MAKKSSKKDSISLIKKGITLLAAVLTFIFMFLEMLAVKTKVTLLGKESVNSEGVKLSEVLFNEDYELVREELSLTTVILWVAFIFTVLAVVVSALSFVMKKGSTFSKLGGILLVVAMLALFVVNLDKASGGVGGLFTGETWITNLTALYFVSLVVSIAGLGSALTLKK